MARNEGRNRNTNDTASVQVIEINSVTAKVLSLPNNGRFYFSVNLESGISTQSAFIRLYPASTDNAKKGILLSRTTAGNDNISLLEWAMPIDNVYTGEISAISENGTFNLIITEY